MLSVPDSRRFGTIVKKRIGHCTITSVGKVESIHLIAEHGGPPVPVQEVAADAGLGLRGDRHHGDQGAGDVTLIEAEALGQLAAEHGLDLTDGTNRRNVVTSGIDLAGLVGRRFHLGEVICVGEERCEPCSHLAGLTDRVVLEGLLHTGLRASIVGSGVIRIGDPVGPTPATHP
jgi:MOSC domain-containing protein YiiM